MFQLPALQGWLRAEGVLPSCVCGLWAGERGRPGGGAVANGEQPEASRPYFEVGLSTAFGCTMEGPVEPAVVAKLARAAIDAGAQELCLSDTTGYAIRHKCESWSSWSKARSAMAS